MPKEYLISYDFREGKDGVFKFQQHQECDTLEEALFEFLSLKKKFSTISLDYRRRK